MFLTTIKPVILQKMKSHQGQKKKIKPVYRTRKIYFDIVAVYEMCLIVCIHF